MLLRLVSGVRLALLTLIVSACTPAHAGAKRFYSTSFNNDTSAAFGSCTTNFHICSAGEWYNRKYDSTISASSLTDGLMYWYSPGGSACSGGLYSTQWNPTSISANGAWTMDGVLTGCGFGSKPVLCCEN